jgi:peptidoglycan/LPS O-acetylase OafA/YrhL
MNHQKFLDTRVFGSLNGLRAIAIIAVVWHHTYPRNEWAASSRGFLGVDLFFVISGFLIVTLLLRERDRRGSIDLGAFYARRTLRIVPLNYAVIFAVWGVSTWTDGSQARMVAHDVPFALTYTANFAPMASMLGICWSLAAEEQFYLAWPLVERHLRRHAVKVLGLALALSLVISCGHAHFGLWTWMPGMFLETTFVPIGLGVWLAHLLHSPGTYSKLRPLLAGRWAAPAAILAIIIATSIPGRDISGLPRLGLHLLMTWLVASCVYREDHGARAIMSNRALSRIGVVSYGIYLLHMISLHVSRAALARLDIVEPAAKFGLTLLLAWGMAEISHATFERFFLRLKGRWAR